MKDINYNDQISLNASEEEIINQIQELIDYTYKNCWNVEYESRPRIAIKCNQPQFIDIRGKSFEKVIDKIANISKKEVEQFLEGFKVVKIEYITSGRMQITGIFINDKCIERLTTLTKWEYNIFTTPCGNVIIDLRKKE